MLRLGPLLFLAAIATAAGGQATQSQAPAAPPPPAAQAPGQTAPADITGDRFPDLRETANKLKENYEKLHGDAYDQIESLMRTRRCQIKRISGLLDRVSEAMRLWQDAELKYWTLWKGEAQNDVDRMMRGKATLEAEQKRALEMAEGARADRERLLREKANLEKYGKRTAEIVERLDALVVDIKESETRLEEALKQEEDVRVRIQALDAQISARLVGIAQSLRDTESIGARMTARYEDMRTSAQELCNKKGPDTTKPVQPKLKVK